MDAPPTFEEMKHAVDSLKSYKPHGSDGLSEKILRLGGDYLLIYLTLAFKICWQAVIVPKQRLHALVPNIYKTKGEKSVFENYRGLSLLNMADKIFVKSISA